MRKLRFLFALIVFYLCFGVHSVFACVPLYIAVPKDYVRLISGLLLTIVETQADGEVKGMINVVQDTINGDVIHEVTSGSLGYNKIHSSASATGGAGETPFSETAYNLIHDRVINDAKSIYEPMRQEGTVEQVMKHIEATLFAPMDSDEEVAIGITAKRKEYLYKVANDLLDLGNKVQKALPADFRTIAGAPVYGDGAIGDVWMDSLTVEAAIRAVAANIALEVQMIELDAVQILMGQSTYLIPKEKGGDVE